MSEIVLGEEKQVALITGGQGDLSKGLCAVLGNESMTVVAPSHAKLDVCDAKSISEFFAQLERLDLLVCNAGMIADKTLVKMDEDQWDRVMEVNLSGAFRVAKLAAKMMMKQRSGHIIFISSYAAFHPSMGQANYAAAKAGLTGLAKSLARELGGRGIRVNVVVPGFMKTKMTAELSEQVLESVMGKHVLGALNTPDRVGKFIQCLHTEMSHTSGQVFNLDSRVI